MSLVEWRPFQELDEEWYFPRIKSDLAADVSHDNENVYIDMNIPGIDSDSLDIEVDGRQLIIAGKREEKKETKKINYFSKDISRGNFYKIIHLPCQVDPENSFTQLTNGVLEITLPKKKQEKVHAHKIKINKK